MRFEILPNLFLITATEFEEWRSQLSPMTDNYVIAVILSNTLSSNYRKKNQFFLLLNYVPTDTAVSKQTMDIVGDAFFKCNKIFVFHDKNDLESIEVFIADFMKRFAGAKSYKSEILNTIRLNLKNYIST